MGLKICIDAGHHGLRDNEGYYGYYESAFVWKIHLALIEELKKYEGVEIVTTRQDINEKVPFDKDISEIKTENRARGRKAVGCDLFISLHTNACETPSVDRAVVFHSVRLPFAEMATRFGKKLYALFAAEFGSTQKYQICQVTMSKTITDWDYYGVLVGASSVGVRGIIIEHSFHTNAAFCKWAMKDGSAEKVAKADAEAIAEQFKLELKREKRTYEIGGFYTILKGDKYTNGKAVPSRYYGDVMTIADVMHGAIRLKEINSWVVVHETEEQEDVADSVSEAQAKVYAVGDKYVVGGNDVYTNGKKVPASIWGREFTVGKIKSGAVLLTEINSWVVVEGQTAEAVKAEAVKKPKYEVGGEYVIKSTDIYTNGVKVPSRYVGKSMTIKQVKEKAILLAEINSWVRTEE